MKPWADSLPGRALLINLTVSSTELQFVWSYEESLEPGSGRRYSDVNMTRGRGQTRKTPSCVRNRVWWNGCTYFEPALKRAAPNGSLLSSSSIGSGDGCWKKGAWSLRTRLTKSMKSLLLVFPIKKDKLTCMSLPKSNMFPTAKSKSWAGVGALMTPLVATTNSGRRALENCIMKKTGFVFWDCVKECEVRG